MTSKQAIEKIKRLLSLEPQKFYEAKTEQGVQLKMEGELELGAPIYVATDEGMIPAPDGVHKLDDGAEIEVADGKISKIKMGEMKTKDEIKEVKDEEEAIADENMSQVELEFGDVKLKNGEIIRIGGDEPSVGLLVKKVSYDGTLSAISDGEYETTGGKVISIVGGAIKGYQDTKDYEARKTGKFVEAKTADGAKVESPTFDVGESIDVVDQDGKKTPAPDGEHQVVLKDSEGNDVKIRVISKDGKIVERENVEEKPEQEMEDEKMTEIAELFKKALEKFENKLDKMESRFSTLETKFNKFSKEPAGEKVYTQKTINEEIPSSSKLDGYRRLVEILSQK
jgi:hypothetical protein